MKALFLACYPIHLRWIEALRTAHNSHKQRGQLGTKIDLRPCVIRETALEDDSRLSFTNIIYKKNILTLSSE